MPTRPKLVRDTGVVFKSFDQYVEEANANKVPFTLPIGDDEALTVECPTSNDIIALTEAQAAQDFVGMATAVFKDGAPRLLTLVGPQRFTVLTHIVQDLMEYYGMQKEQLPES